MSIISEKNEETSDLRRKFKKKANIDEKNVIFFQKRLDPLLILRYNYLCC